MSGRDDFNKDTKDILARRAGGSCSNPECMMNTFGPHAEDAKATNIGVAAHITAAAKGGPRYDSSMSPEGRKDITNGIWLCQTCSRLIDVNPVEYPIILLQEWKDSAENKASEKLNKQLKNAPTNWRCTSDNELIDINPDGFYEQNVGDFITRTSLIGDLLHVELEFAPDVIAYHVLDKDGNVVHTTMAHPLSEYEIVIEKGMVLNTTQRNEPNGNTITEYEMKWDKKAIVSRDPEGKLLDFTAKSGCIINHPNKQIIFQRPDKTN